MAERAGACALETRAAIVSPVITWGPVDNVTIHYAGGVTRIAEDGDVRSLERQDLMFHGLDELAFVHEGRRPRSRFTACSYVPTSCAESGRSMSRS